MKVIKVVDHKALGVMTYYKTGELEQRWTLDPAKAKNYLPATAREICDSYRGTNTSKDINFYAK